MGIPRPPPHASHDSPSHTSHSLSHTETPQPDHSPLSRSQVPTDRAALSQYPTENRSTRYLYAYWSYQADRLRASYAAAPIWRRFYLFIRRAFSAPYGVYRFTTSASSYTTLGDLDDAFKSFYWARTGLVVEGMFDIGRPDVEEWIDEPSEEDGSGKVDEIQVGLGEICPEDPAYVDCSRGKVNVPLEELKRYWQEKKDDANWLGKTRPWYQSWVLVPYALRIGAAIPSPNNTLGDLDRLYGQAFWVEYGWEEPGYFSTRQEDGFEGKSTVVSAANS